MAYENSGFRSTIDGRYRITVPKPLLDMAKIKTCVEFEITNNGILMKPFNPVSLEYCAVCKSLDSKSLLPIERDRFICTDCVSKILKRIGPCQE